MSYGLVICSICRREVHQNPGDNDHGWHHCENKLPMCVGATAVYPEPGEEPKGKWCGRDRGPSSNPMTAKAVAAFTGEQIRLPGNFRKKIGNNDPCPCGSGKKYKHCCRE